MAFPSIIISYGQGHKRRATYRQVFPPGEAASPAVGIVAAAEVADSGLSDPASTSTPIGAGDAAGEGATLETAESEAPGAAPAREAEGVSIDGASLETAASEAEGAEPVEEADGATRADEAADEAAEMTASGIEIDGEADCEDGA